MKTEQWIAVLAQGAGPAPRGLAARRLGWALAAGLVASVGVSVLGLGPVPGAMYATAAPWFKLAYAAALAASALWLSSRLGRPLAAGTAPPVSAVAAVVVLAALLGLADWSGTPVSARLPALFGHSSWSCPVAVLGLSLPALGAMLWALRGLAPTRPRAAGAAAGLAAGAAGAFGYALSCTEPAISFSALWYTAGIAASAALGALLGARALRW